MSRLAFTWELGVGTGYAATIGRIAQEAVDQGHECIFIVRDLHAAAAQLPAPLGLFVQAPVATTSRARPVRVQTSYATLLHNCGFGDADALTARMRAWHDLFRSLGVERVAARHSPTAVLAARSMHLPVLHYGQPFTVPPDVTPWPSFRPDLRISDEALAQNEAQVLGVVNAALAAFGALPLARLRDVFDGLSTALLSYPEFDPYAETRPQVFVGLPEISFGDAPAWPEGPEPTRLFVSLLPGAHTRAWMDALGELPARSLVRFQGPATLPAPKSPRVRVTASVHFATAVSECTAVIGYGSHNLACLSLLAGKPMAALAHTPDQLMTAQSVQAAGCGVILPEQPDAEARRMLAAWLAEPSFSTRARRFAERKRTPSRDGIPRELLRRLLAATPIT